MINLKTFLTFQKASITYFYSSLFFPNNVREDVFNFYNFVRVADNYVDSIPQKPKEFYKFCEDYKKAYRGAKTSNKIINNFVSLSIKKSFDPRWITAFLNAMELDLKKTNYKSMDELLEYMFGSSDVIGLMMAKIMELPKEAYLYAALQGRAMQYVNFIRDIDEDLTLNRIYFPLETLAENGLLSIDKISAKQNPKKFNQFIRKQIHIYYRWQKQAEIGYKYIPKRYLIPIKTSSDMYNWTANKIYKNPMVIFDKKIKPSPFRVLSGIILNIQKL